MKSHGTLALDQGESLLYSLIGQNDVDLLPPIDMIHTHTDCSGSTLCPLCLEALRDANEMMWLSEDVTEKVQAIQQGTKTERSIQCLS